MATVETLLTAEEYLRLPNNGQPTELVRGRIVTLNMPGFRHGQVCTTIVRILGNFLDRNDLGHLIGNDSGIQTEHNPDTIRGADVAFYSYARLPCNERPEGYPSVVPELVFEVRSPTDRNNEVLAKVAEYLAAGVARVCVLDPRKESVKVYSQDDEQNLAGDDELTFPDILPGFAVPVRKLFA